MNTTGHSRKSAAEFFFVRNTFARLALIGLLAGGVIAYSGMIRETNPDLQIGVGIIQTEWAGSDPNTIEQEITREIEKKLKSLQGVKRIQSGSFSGFSIVSVEFFANVPQQDAMARLRAKVSEAEGEFPSAVSKPKITESSISDTPIFSVQFFGMDNPENVGEAVRALRRKIERVPGVNRARISGDREEIIQVRLIGAHLSALGISPITVSNAIRQAGVDMPWGDFDGESIGSGFRLTARFRDIKDLQRLPVKRTASGRTIYLEEVADVKRGFEKETSRTFFADLAAGPQEDSPPDYQPALEISVTKRPGSDALKTIDAVKELIESEAARDSWPAEMHYQVVHDESEYINADLLSIFNNGWQAMLAVFVILFISLTWREAFIAGLAVPVTFATGLLIVWLLGYTLNSIVVAGMVLALGLLVDDFILMMEGMHENIYVEGRTFADAALTTVKTYAIPSLSGSLTTILAMAPLLAVAGVEGKFIRQMPMTTIACLVASYLISIFIAIPLSGFVLHRKRDAEPAKKTWMDRVTAHYGAALAGLLKAVFIRQRWLAALWIAASVALFVYSFVLFSSRPLELLPKNDGRTMGITVELSPDTSLETAQQYADELGEIFLNKPYLSNVLKHVGSKSHFSTVSVSDQLSPAEGSYLIGFSLIFQPKAERDRSVYQYVPELRAEIEAAMINTPGAVLTMTPDLGGASPEPAVRIELIGDDMNVLRQLALAVEGKLIAIPGTSDVRNNFGTPKLDIRAVPRREALDFFNFDARSFADQVRSLMISDEIGKFVVGDLRDDLKIRMGYAWPTRNGEVGGPTNYDELYLMNVTSSDGRQVPLSTLADFRVEESALSIMHKDGERAVAVMAQTDGRTASEILTDLMPELEQMSAEWPSGYRYAIAGEAESNEAVFGSAGKMLLLAIFLVFALLVLQFDNFKQPFIIMSAIPLALTGTFLGFYLLQLSFSFMAMVGVIALIGIVVNDTIIMIETMNNHRRNGLSVSESAARGAADRLRPIITTSVTTIVGLIPLAISQELYMPLSATVISGLVFSTVLALLIVPCLYLCLTSESA